MSDYLTIKWGSSCTYDDIYYNDGYSDFLFILAKQSDVIEPIYEVIKKEASEKVGRTLSPNKISRKTYKVTFKATESLADTLNTIPLANIVMVQFPDDSVATIKGDDVTVNIQESQYDKYSGINFFNVELLFLTNVTIKKECCATLDTIPENLTPPEITDTYLTSDGQVLMGESPVNYFIRAYGREFWQETKGAIKVYKSCTFSKLGAYFITTDKKIFKTVNGFVSCSLLLDTTYEVYDIQCYRETHIIAVGDNGLYISTDSGLNWTFKSVLGTRFRAVRIKNTTQIAFCGDAGSLYLSNDFGSHITLQTTPSVENLTGIDFVTISSLDYWVVVGENGTNIYQSLNVYTVDNTFTTNINYGVVDLNDCKFYGTTVFACGNNGDIIKSIDYGNNWTVVSTGDYTSFKSLCVCKYGLLIVGVENIIIDAINTITNILDDNTDINLDCSAYVGLVDHSEYKTSNSISVMNGNNSFIEVGLSTSEQFLNYELILNLTHGRTYVAYVEAFLPQFTGGISSEILIEYP